MGVLDNDCGDSEGRRSPDAVDRQPDSRQPDSRPPDSRPPDSRPPDSLPADSRPPAARLPDPRPWRRLQLFGAAALSDAECVALFLGGAGSRRGSAMRRGSCPVTTGEAVLRRCGGLAGIAGADPGELTEIPGVGPAGAAALVGAVDLARRVLEAEWTHGRPLRGPVDVAQLVRERTRGERRESFYAVLLDARHRPLGVVLVGVGTLRSAPVHPREVFGPALRRAAAAVVVAHNHPSGDPTPSDEDGLVTDRLREVGELCGVELLDHVVVGARSFYSFAEQGERPLPDPLAALTEDSSSRLATGGAPQC